MSQSGGGSGAEPGVKQREINARLEPSQPWDSRANMYKIAVWAQRLGIVTEVQGTGLPGKLTLMVPGFFASIVLTFGGMGFMLLAPDTVTSRWVFWGVIGLAWLVVASASLTSIVLVLDNRRERRKPPNNEKDPARLIIRVKPTGIHGIYDPRTGTFTEDPTPPTPKTKSGKRNKNKTSWR